MSKRRRLLWRWALICTVPVAVGAAVLLGVRAGGDAPYVADGDEEGITRRLDREADAAASGVRFAEVTAAAGISFEHFPDVRTSQLPEDMGSGAAWGDYDGDGLPDLFLVNFAAALDVTEAELAASTATDRLFRNRGDGTFEDVTEAAGVGRAHSGMGAAWADHDADGDLDLFVTAWGRTVLWENRGDGTFRDATARAGLAEEGFWAGASWADFDLDGDLDLYVCGYVAYEAEEPGSPLTHTGDADYPFTLNPSSYAPHENRLWVNRGDGTFRDGTREAGVLGEMGRSLSAAWIDLDEDGYPELYVANDVSDNQLFRNRGDGTFEDVSYPALVADYRGAMGIGVGDWDGDLDVDLFITHWIAQENALYTNQYRDMAAEPEERRLFFGDDGVSSGLGQISLDLIGWGTDFADLNGDGLLDLFVANGSTFQDRDDPTLLLPMDPHLYWNRGPEEGFFEIGEGAGVRTDPPGVGRGAAFADYDRDGDPDLVVVRHGGRARLLRNDSRGSRRLALRLRGRSGHPSALGARVEVWAGGKAQVRVVGSGAPYLSQNDTEVLIGLGDAARADSVTVHWPRGGVETFADLQAGRAWELTEEGAAVEGRAFGDRGGPPSRDVAGAGSRTRRTSDVSRFAVRADLRSTLGPEERARFWALDREAARHLAQGRWTDAIASLDAMLALDPGHEDGRYERGNAYLELGRYAEAKRDWDSLLVVEPASGRAWTQIGVVHTMREAGPLYDLEAAEEAFRRAHDLYRDQSQPLVLLGEVEVALGQLDSAAVALETGWRMNDRSASALFLSGYVAWKRGDTAAATGLAGRAGAALGGLEAAAGASGEGGAGWGRGAGGGGAAPRRRLFAACLEQLDAGAPEEAFACVDREREALAGRRPSRQPGR